MEISILVTVTFTLMKQPQKRALHNVLTFNMMKDTSVICWKPQFDSHPPGQPPIQ